MRKTLIVLTFVAGLVAACSGSAATGGLPAGGLPAGGTQPGGTQAAVGATDNPTAGAVSGLDPCSLVTAAEASTVLGEPIDPGKISSPGAPYCYLYDHALAGDSVEIYLTAPLEFLPNQSSTAGVFEVTQASGVGDAAYYANDVGTGTVGLSVKKGATTFVVSVVLKNASIAKLEDMEKTLAISVAGRV